jgi:YhcH/YjgK/YiaL family protein
MVIDSLQNADRYASLHPGFEAAFNYLRTAHLQAAAPGRHPINGDELFAIIQEYDTIDAAAEQMEAHKKYIDIQYMISGAELVGHALLSSQQPSKAYDAENDFMLFGEVPSFFTRMDTGTFMIFFPTDLHMPCIKEDVPVRVKKVVIKVRV